jgi:diguanylate cyclase (GGDEF)-like protein
LRKNRGNELLYPKDVLQERYLIIRQLGRGGMGTVYEAIDQSVSSIVALKEAEVKTDEQMIAFEREAKLLANLRHPALPRVSHHFAQADKQYLVMEFIEGKDLDQLLARRGAPFSIQQVLKWADDLLGLLEYLHTRPNPIFHRDIKPSNLRLTERGELFLLDFGLAKGSAGQMSTVGDTGLQGFTPAYASLEQIRGTGTDQGSDIYSLGATLHHLITGQPPPDSLKRLDAVANGEMDPLELTYQACQEVPQSLCDIITWAMSLNRKNRPASASEMRHRLRSTCSSITFIDNTDGEFISSLRDSRLLTAANRIGTAVHSSLELSVILQTTVDEVGKALNVGSCALCVRAETPEKNLNYFYFANKSDCGSIQQQKITAGFDFHYSHLVRHQQTIIRDADETIIQDVNDKSASDDKFPIVVVPLVYDERLLGALQVNSDELARVWGENEILLLNTVANQVAVAVNHTYLFALIEQQALTDSLTGCYNRRAFEMQLDREIKIAKRQDQPLSVIMIDIDHLKSINETCGSKAGDMVLTSVTELFREELRGVDTAARYGRADFTLILPWTSLKGATDVAERIRARIENLKTGKFGPVSASIGVATLSNLASSRDLLVEAADRALSLAKRTGRNCVCSAED